MGCTTLEGKHSFRGGGNYLCVGSWRFPQLSEAFSSTPASSLRPHSAVINIAEVLAPHFGTPRTGLLEGSSNVMAIANPLRGLIEVNAYLRGFAGSRYVPCSPVNKPRSARTEQFSKPGLDFDAIQSSWGATERYHKNNLVSRRRASVTCEQMPQYYSQSTF